MNTPLTGTSNARNGLKADLALVAGLIGLCVAARILPHAPNFTPVAASALFAGTVLRHRALAVLVPLLGMFISNVIIGFDGWPMTLVIYALFTLPALVAWLPKRLRAPGMYLPLMVGFSLFFFVVTNFMVWLVGGLYPPTLAGLAACYIAALPYLQQTVVGDLFWAAVLFAGAALVQAAPAYARRRA